MCNIVRIVRSFINCLNKVIQYPLCVGIDAYIYLYYVYNIVMYARVHPVVALINDKHYTCDNKHVQNGFKYS